MREQGANQGSRTGDGGVDRRRARRRHQSWISSAVGCRPGSPDLSAPAPAAALDSGTVKPGDPPGRGDDKVWRGWCALRCGALIDEEEQADVGKDRRRHRPRPRLSASKRKAWAAAPRRSATGARWGRSRGGAKPSNGLTTKQICAGRRSYLGKQEKGEGILVPIRRGLTWLRSELKRRLAAVRALPPAGRWMGPSAAAVAR